MEEQGYIKLKVENRDNSLTPKDVDINDVKKITPDNPFMIKRN